MRIDEIHVDGFGLLRDRRIEPAPGLTVIRGENEAGKSTLLAFIRAILFGFDPKNPAALADLLERMERKVCGPKQCGPNWLGSHPATALRAARLRKF